jgi:hypothetical protein
MLKIFLNFIVMLYIDKFSSFRYVHKSVKSTLLTGATWKKHKSLFGAARGLQHHSIYCKATLIAYCLTGLCKIQAGVPGKVINNAQHPISRGWPLI